MRLEVPGGRLHIDRPLPFLCVYRSRGEDVDGGPLVHGQSSYLIVDGDGCPDQVARLTTSVVDLLAEKFGSVLLVEVWIVPAPVARRPKYSIVLADPDTPPAIDALGAALACVDPRGRAPQVDVITDAVVAPEGFDPLIDSATARTMGCLHVGLSVPATFADPSSGRRMPSSSAPSVTPRPITRQPWER